MDIKLELLLLAKLILALLLGGIVGFERERDNKEAGIRTYASIAVGSCAFLIISLHFTDDKAATARVVSAIITGLGFIGAGVIFKGTDSKLSGLTTSASLWCTAAIGISLGLDMYFLAIGITAILFFILSLHHQKWYQQWTKALTERHRKKHFPQ